LATADQAEHDALYQRLFSHPGVVAQLVRGFVSGPWLDELDLERMERLNAKFHATTGQRREGDMVWRIPHREGGDAYLVLGAETRMLEEWGVRILEARSLEDVFGEEPA
jgi:hypothetical protein